MSPVCEWKLPAPNNSTNFKTGEILESCLRIVVWFGLVWCDLVWFGLVWFGLVGLVWFKNILPGMKWIHSHPCRRSGKLVQRKKAENRNYLSWKLATVDSVDVRLRSRDPSFIKGCNGTIFNQKRVSLWIGNAALPN